MTKVLVDHVKVIVTTIHSWLEYHIFMNLLRLKEFYSSKCAGFAKFTEKHEKDRICKKPLFQIY